MWIWLTDGEVTAKAQIHLNISEFVAEVAWETVEHIVTKEIK